MHELLQLQWWKRFQLCYDSHQHHSHRAHGNESVALGIPGGSANSRFHTDRRVMSWKQRLTNPTYEQSTVLMLIIFESILYFVIGQIPLVRNILMPFQILSTVFHEFGHVLACWLTGGTVTNIHISLFEDSLTRFKDGIMFFILPAGYIGSTLAGSLLIFASFGRRTALWTAGSVVAMLVMLVYFADDMITIGSGLLLIIALVGLLYWHKGIYSRHVIIALGSVCSMHSLLVLFKTSISATSQSEADMAVFARDYSLFLPPVLFGLLWLLFSLALYVLSFAAGIIFFC